MKELKDYISRAYHYTAPAGTSGGIIDQRKEFISYCEKNHLDEEFQRLVVQDPKWQELAENNQVYFFSNRVVNLDGELKLPELRLIRTEMEKVPVIELLIEKKMSDDIRFWLPPKRPRKGAFFYASFMLKKILLNDRILYIKF